MLFLIKNRWMLSQLWEKKTFVWYSLLRSETMAIQVEWNVICRYIENLSIGLTYIIHYTILHQWSIYVCINKKIFIVIFKDKNVEFICFFCTGFRTEDQAPNLGHSWTREVNCSLSGSLLLGHTVPITSVADPDCEFFAPGSGFWFWKYMDPHCIYNPQSGCVV